MDMGRINPGDSGERFCMSTFACNTCQEVNGVSWLHGEVSKSMFSGIWKGYFPEESHVGYVTNGVHFPTWAASEWKGVYNKHFDKKFMGDQSNQKIWEEIYNVSDEEVWNTRLALKHGTSRMVGDHPCRKQPTSQIARQTFHCTQEPDL